MLIILALPMDKAGIIISLDLFLSLHKMCFLMLNLLLLSVKSETYPLSGIFAVGNMREKKSFFGSELLITSSANHLVVAAPNIRKNNKGKELG